MTRGARRRSLAPDSRAVRLAWLSLVCAGLLSAQVALGVRVPPIAEIPVHTAAAHPELLAKREALLAVRAALRVRRESLESTYSRVREGSLEDERGRRELADLETDLVRHVEACRIFADEVSDKALHTEILLLAGRSRWKAPEVARLDAALNALVGDGHAGTPAEIREVWSRIFQHERDVAVVRDAKSDGDGFPGSGLQSDFSDCAIYAIANATGRPYSWVAAQAMEMIRAGEWRLESERANPAGIFEAGDGLNGGEVVMLAEGLGQAEVVDSADLAARIRAGGTVLVEVVPSDGSGAHEVALTRAFPHRGETWFVMLDSHLGAVRRAYLSAAELDAIQIEKGVAFRPEPGVVPGMLR